jgi:hypothetical protein
MNGDHEEGMGSNVYAPRPKPEMPSQATPYINGYKRLSPVLRASQNGLRVQFWCPGCDDSHDVLVAGDGAWGWNGDVNRPTFEPSIKTDFLKTRKDNEGRWDGGWVMKHGEPVKMICHTFVRDGVIEFLSDCTHAMAGLFAPLDIWYTHETEGLPGRPARG